MMVKQNMYGFLLKCRNHFRKILFYGIFFFEAAQPLHSIFHKLHVCIIFDEAFLLTSVLRISLIECF